MIVGDHEFKLGEGMIYDSHKKQYISQRKQMIQAKFLDNQLDRDRDSSMNNIVFSFVNPNAEEP